ncbi:MAG: hypothetical protein IJ191_09120 [Treponema sp.]|nr:hypothetical protein [Treponema sp.]
MSEIQKSLTTIFMFSDMLQNYRDDETRLRSITLNAIGDQLYEVAVRISNELDAIPEK